MADNPFVAGNPFAPDDPMDRFPGIEDLERRAKRRIPRFAWEYLDQGTARDEARDRNLTSLAEVQFLPKLLRGRLEPDIETELFGVRYAAPIGIAPIGLTDLIWPGAGMELARTAAANRIPVTLSTVGTESPESVGEAAPGLSWFQLYPPRSSEMRTSLIDRAHRAGFTTLVVTADVPAPSRRERQRKAGVRIPPVIGPSLVAQAAIRPLWSRQILRHGFPRFRGLEAYVDTATMADTTRFVGANLGGTLSWSYLADVREQWDGPLVVKGILDPDDAQRCVDAGADAVQVSNHGGRQLDGAPGCIGVLPVIVDKIAEQVPVLFDSGIRSGLDVARAIALGASFVFCGRAFLFGVAALGDSGGSHAYRILSDDLVNVMHQLGCDRLSQLQDRLAP